MHCRLLIIDVILAPVLLAGFLFANRKFVTDASSAFSQNWGQLLFECIVCR